MTYVMYMISRSDTNTIMQGMELEIVIGALRVKIISMFYFLLQLLPNKLKEGI